MDSIQPSPSLVDKNSIEPNELLDSSSSSSLSSSSSSSSASSLSSSSPSLSASSPPTTKTVNATQDHKSDLRSIKTELFNKLTGSQSQTNNTTTGGSIATSTLKQNTSDASSVSLNCLNASNSLAGIKRISNSTTTICDDGQQHSTKTFNSSNNNKQQLCPLDDLKQGASLFSRVRARWYTNDEVASILTSFASHPEWQTNELQIRPKSGAVLLYSREKVRYRQDGYCWKKRKNGRTTREDHMKLKVQGIECIYGCYVHSAILPTFHRRCYWLLQNPDIVLVHYLNQPPDDQNKLMLTFNSSLLEEETRRSWTNEEIIEEIGSVFGGISQIQQTLNINFPSCSTAALVTSPPPLVDITNEEQALQTSTIINNIRDNDRMLDSTSQAQLSQASCDNNALDEHLDHTITIDHHHPNHPHHHQQQQHQQQFHEDKSSISRQQSVENARKVTDEERLLSTLSNTNSTCTVTNNQTDNYNSNNNQHIGTAIINQLHKTTDNINSTSNMHCDDQLQSNGHEQEQELRSQEDDLISMTFDIVNDCNENNENTLHNIQSRELVCYGDYNSSSTNSNNVNNRMDDDANSNNSLNVDRLPNPDGQHSTNRVLEQNPCSPVTQIYNKIVDDIETYALPLEPNQFVSNHHHHHHHPHHQQQSELIEVSTLPIQPMQLGDANQHGHSSHQQLQHELQLHNHHHQSQQQHQQTLQTQQQEHEHQHAMFQLNQQYTGHQDVLPVNELDCMSKEPPMGLSMDLTSCDLFSNDQDHDRSSVKEEHNDAPDDDSLLLVNFNLHSNATERVNDDQFSVVESSINNVGDSELSSYYGNQRFTPTVGLLTILDYVPNWCNITGGAKVLIVGNWSSLCNVEQNQLPANMELKQDNQCSTDHSLFHALFDDQLVPATLIQDNVLRCYVPSHEQGFITLKILFKHCIISEQVLFEMRPSCNQTNSQNGASIHTQNSKMGVDSANDHNSSKSNTHNTHKNSTSSSQSISASSSSFSSNLQQLVHVSSSSTSGGDNSRVLSLAENIISAMHRKNNSATSLSTVPTCGNGRIVTNADGISRNFDWRLANSLDIESSDRYQRLNDHQRQQSVKSVPRRWTGSRSLSRDSELNSSYTGAINFNCIEYDPYWHKEPAIGSGLMTMQPLSVMTDLPQSMQQATHNPTSNTGSHFSTQKRHSSGSSGFPSNYQQFQSAFIPYNQHHQQFHHKLPHHHPQESQNLTETSSSGLGSIMSSLSPSNSSLHSPLSICTGAQELGSGARVENQSPTCSCGRQSTSTPTSADFCEYFQASAKTQESFSSLTLNDREQQELYEAAKIIQKAYRTYRGRKRQASELLSTFSNTGSDEHLSTSESCNSVAFKNELVPPSQQQQVENQTQQQRYSFGCSKTQVSPGFQKMELEANSYQDREMQAATIIQAYYRRYRQYAHYKRQQMSSSNRSLLTSTGAGMVPNLTISPAYKLEQRSSHQNARLVVDTLPVFIDKATTSHVDRKRFKTAILISGGGSSNANHCTQNAN